jgi:hypothetical protein
MKLITSFLLALLLVLVFVAGGESAQAAGLLYTVRDSDDHLIAIDTETLAQTDIGPLGVTFQFGGLGYDPVSDKLYMIGGDVNPALYTVNRLTGAATLIGNTGLTRLFGLDYDTANGVLYASQYAPSSPALYSLNKTTGAATLIGQLSGTGFGALAYDPSNDRLLGLTADLGDLYEINPNTAATNLLSDGPHLDDGGLAFDLQHGLIWAIDNSGGLFSYDPAANYARSTRLSGIGAHDGLAFVIPEPGSVGLVVLAGGGLWVAGGGRRRKAETLKS